MAEHQDQAVHRGPVRADKAMGNGPGTSEGAGHSDSAVVKTAAEAAENLIFSRLAREDVRDLDVTVTFESGILEVDVYLNAPEADEPEAAVADDAALAAQAAVDELLE